MSKTTADRMKKNHLPEAKEVRTISDFLYEALNLARGLMEGFHLVNVEAVGGLSSALDEFCQTTGKLFNKRCEFQPEIQVKIENIDCATNLFRIVQEATHNAIKHGEPGCVLVSMRKEGDDLLVTVENDGKSMPELSPDSEGIGIRTMKYRADLIGADLRFENRPEGGVIVTCRIPATCGLEFLAE